MPALHFHGITSRSTVQYYGSTNSVRLFVTTMKGVGPIFLVSTCGAYSYTPSTLYILVAFVMSGASAPTTLSTLYILVSAGVTPYLSTPSAVAAATYSFLLAFACWRSFNNVILSPSIVEAPPHSRERACHYWLCSRGPRRVHRGCE